MFLSPDRRTRKAGADGVSLARNSALAARGQIPVSEASQQCAWVPHTAPVQAQTLDLLACGGFSWFGALSRYRKHERIHSTP